MLLEELKNKKAPFFVHEIGKRGKPLKALIEVVGFTENDPLGVGGGIFPNITCVYFKNGAWLDVDNFLQHYVFSS